MRCHHLFGRIQRISPEDPDGYIRSLAAREPPTEEDWFTVSDLIQAVAVSSSQGYRMLKQVLCHSGCSLA